MIFQKPATTIDEQIELLKKRGMQISNLAEAKHYLSHISYYRLRAYWMPFEGPVPATGEHIFVEGTTFKDVADLYIFDRKLRLLVLDAIERIEVSVRGHWAHHMALQHNPHGYINKDLYANARHFEESLGRLKKGIEDSTDTFIQHYQTKYSLPEMPPVWMAAELLSLGQLSKWYKNLNARQNRQAIAKHYGLDEKILSSFIENATHVRNICAHHGRLWNKQFTVTMRAAKSPASLSIALDKTTNDRRIYMTHTTRQFAVRAEI